MKLDSIILGAHGQDGRLLCERKSGQSVLALGRDDVDLLDQDSITSLLKHRQPAEVYYLAAHHHSSEDPAGSDDAALFRRSFEVHVTGLIHFLEAIRKESPATRLFYAASSHIFGPTETS